MAQLLNTLAFWRRWKEERIRLERLEERRKEEERLLECLREHFERDFLTAYDFYRTHCTNHISLEEYNSEKINYVQSWAQGGLEFSPDPEQAAAIGAVDGNVQVIARAGSGKTATLVSRALFLQQHCRVDTDELLLLAFNKKAAEEMKERIGTLPHVMTFHALAYALVQPKNILIDEPDGGQSQSRALQDVVNQYLSDPDYADQIRDLMMEHFRDDWEQHEDWKRIVSEGYGPNAAEILRYRRSLTRETLDGKYVKSFGEKVIANFLFEHGIGYRYERAILWNGVNYCPDFTIFTEGGKHDIVIEYFGMAGDPDYDAMSAEKRGRQNYLHRRQPTRYAGDE
jgi:DNA helicase-4